MGTTNELILMNKIVVDTGKSTQHVDKLSNSFRSQGDRVSKLERSILSYHNIQKKGITLNATSQRTLRNSIKHYEAMGGSAKKLTGTHRDLLGTFTRYRWALVNAALAVGVLYGAYNLLLKPAIELETEMANVQKTTQLSSEEIKGLKKELIDLSKELPNSAKDLAQIAAIAGQLGITGTENISNFTRVVAMMTTATELSAEDSAKALGKISNAFNLPLSGVNNLGSVINELSNTTAATSTDIVNSLTRIGAAASNLGLTVDFASALSSTLIDSGMRAERAGTRIRSVLSRISGSMSAIKDALPNMDFKEFSHLLETDTNQAVLMLIHSFDELGNSAQTQTKIIDTFGSVGGFAFQTLVNNVDNLEQNYKTSNNEFETGISLLKETSIQIGTTANQYKLLSNDLKAVVLNNDGLINSFLKGMRASLLARNLASKQMKEGKIGGIEGFFKTYTPFGEGASDKTIQKGVTDLKAKLKGIVPSDTYSAYEKLINQQEDVSIRYSIAEQALSIVEGKYKTLGAEIKNTVDNLSEQDKVLIQNDQEYLNAIQILDVINEKKELNIDLTQEEIIALEELNNKLSEYGKDSSSHSDFQSMFADGLRDTIASIKGADIGDKLIDSFLGGDMSSVLNEFLSGFKDISDIPVPDKLENQLNSIKEVLVGENVVLDDQLKLVGLNEKQLRDYIEQLRNQESVELSITNAIGLYEESMSKLNVELDNAKNKQSDFSNAISSTEKSIDNILNRRFKINGISETDITGLIGKQELEIARAEFNALNLGSAEDFLRNAVVKTSDSISGQATALDALSDAAETSQSKFDAWETTLKTTIRELLMNSQDLDKDVTDVVRNAQTKLLSITNSDSGTGTSSGGDDQFSSLNDNLEALRLAEQIFFGEEQLNLELSEQAREDRMNGFNESSEQAISLLESERTTLADLTAQEAEWGSEIERLTNKINDESAAIARENELLKENNMLKGGSGLGSINVQSDEEREARLDIARAKSSPAYAREHGITVNDFISRPGTPIQSFSPQDTIIGVKQPEKLLNSGNTNNISINIQGGRFNERQLAIEIKRELSSLALT